MGKRLRRTSSSSSSSSSSSCSSSILKYSDAQTLFAVLLSALSDHEFQEPTQDHLMIIQKTLDHFLHSLLSNSPNSIFHHQLTLPIPLISLLPVLIYSKCSEIAISGLEIVGAACLFSFEMNEQISLDGEIVKGLINALESPERNVMMAACNAVLDLSTTSVGRSRLLEFAAIHNLISCFLQVPKSSAPSISLIMEEADEEFCFRIGFMEAEFPILLLQVTIILISDCTIEQLEKIPRELSKDLLKYLRSLSAEIHKHLLLGTIQELGPERFFYTSNIRTNNLAECIFRLSMNEAFTTPSNFQEIKRSIFNLDKISFEYFILNHWETAPLLMPGSSHALLPSGVYSSFLQFLRSEEALPLSLASLLQNLTSALPISSDELDILSFLKEVRDRMGCPLLYGQDIRVLKTVSSKGEVHFFKEPSDSYGSKIPHFTAFDSLRCEEAYNDGYTFALRGMEFHFEEIATVAEGLACLFGQPSTGVNMYLTPPNSQGLACHRDDHCVLVCQIRGVKKWKIFPNPCLLLPRLYEPIDDFLDLEGENPIVDECKEFFLREGDILYIPRGFPHEARTVINHGTANGNAEFSLHLTLAIEIEPPFEWEGFAHVALYCWNQNQNTHFTCSEFPSWDLNAVSVWVLHIAISLIGDVDPAFRKACLVGAISLLSVTEGWLEKNQKLIFSHLLKRITEARFNDVISRVEAAVQKHEDLFEKFRWLRHLHKGEAVVDLHDQKMSLIGAENLFHLMVHEKDQVEAAFMEVKSKFCSEVVFEDVEQHYTLLLEKYRRTRKQYMNGMLSLNCD